MLRNLVIPVAQLEKASPRFARWTSVLTRVCLGLLIAGCSWSLLSGVSDAGELWLMITAVVWACMFLPAWIANLAHDVVVELAVFALFCVLCAALSAWGFVLSAYI